MLPSACMQQHHGNSAPAAFRRGGKKSRIGRQRMKCGNSMPNWQLFRGAWQGTVHSKACVSAAPSPAGLLPAHPDPQWDWPFLIPNQTSFPFLPPSSFSAGNPAPPVLAPPAAGGPKLGSGRVLEYKSSHTVPTKTHSWARF